MSFTGSSFIYDGISSEMFGLMLCNFSGTTQEAGTVGARLSIQEDRIARRCTSLHYGVTDNDAKEFPVVLVVRDENRRLDRYEIAQIGAWLSGDHEYKELAILQSDMEGVFYRCIITDLEQLEVGMRTIGFTATVSCDGPYAYRRMPSTKAELSGSTSLLYHNYSNVKGYYLPEMEIQCTGSSLLIQNQTDGTMFSLDGMPSGARTIHISCQNQVMTSSDGINLYQYWNVDTDKYVPRFVRGDNRLMIAGADMITIQNVFPWNVGN